MESEHIILNSSRKLIFETYDINNLDILLKLYNVVEYLSRRSRIPPRKVYKIIYIPVELYVEYKEHNNNDWIELQLNDRIFNYGDKTITFNFNDNKRYDLKIYGNTLRDIQDENLSKKFYKTLNDSGNTTITYTLLENNVNNVDNNDTTNNDTTTVVTDNTETDTNTDETTTPTTTSTVSEGNRGGGGTLMNDSIEIDDYIYRFQIIKRQIGNTQLEEKLNNRDGVIYIINDSKSKDYGLKTSSLYVGDGKGFDYLSYDSIDGLNIKSKKVEIISDGGVVDIATKFKQTDNEMSLKVEKNDVVNQINLSNEGIKIDGVKLNITGDTIFNNNVRLQGLVEADKSLIINSVDGLSRLILQDGNVRLYERANTEDEFLPTAKLGKIVSGNYVIYNNNNNEWINLLNYTNGFTLENFIILNSIKFMYRFNNLIKYNINIERNNENKYLFRFNPEILYEPFDDISKNIDYNENFIYKLNALYTTESTYIKLNGLYGNLKLNFRIINLTFHNRGKHDWFGNLAIFDVNIYTVLDGVRKLEHSFQTDRLDYSFNISEKFNKYGIKSNYTLEVKYKFKRHDHYDWGKENHRQINGVFRPFGVDGHGYEENNYKITRAPFKMVVSGKRNNENVINNKLLELEWVAIEVV